jgi:hypothetical protein
MAPSIPGAKKEGKLFPLAEKRSIKGFFDGFTCTI